MVEFECPSCGARCSARFLIPDPRNPERFVDHPDGAPVLIHAEPTCELFEKVETLDEATGYIRAARLKHSN